MAVRESGDFGHPFADPLLVILHVGSDCREEAGDNGRLGAFSRLVIETTGLADPAPILNVLVNHPYLAMRFRLDGVVTLVDAVNGMATLDAQPESIKQAALADRLVLTKTDLADDAATAALGDRLIHAREEVGEIALHVRADALVEAMIASVVWDQ